ncbi:MAG: 50S ribosomal protein L9 [Verrucomicrobia bacterium]|nr:50S ribosomal protein L9 [Verrucomicrobiota bacterium]MBU4246795.1 50S ribosomal protein L9 [Verrucomicrobiota bacterium]MBU4290571.1 50S ribosomal protein L9 [Verrucomicrobiota bacterium]MBU4496595.1 50S ribosomal protein L9 [Verrucomicrobiota bacterium]MCG2681213.1 50S ribosomal protein L9 [Kiritimatiellia bacterium]
MSRELILMTDVEGLGLEGAKVKVADGYARNFLIPRKLAVPISQAALKRLEKNRLARELRQQNDRESAQALVASLEKISCTIAVKVGENDKLFGSVTIQDIADSLKAQDLELDKRKIHLSEPIRELGVYSVKIKLHPEVETSLKVWVVGE